jgi:putative membrane protein
MVAFVAAIPVSAKNLLRGENSVREDLKDLLSTEDMTDIESALNGPNYCIDVLGHYLAKQVRTGKLTDHQLGVINMTCITQFSAAVGAMERLRNSFIPVIYTLHQRMIMMSWLLLLSLHFLNKFWWYTIPLGFLVAYILIGMDSMSCEIEEPFGYDQNDLDLTKFCAGIIRDTQEILGRRSKLSGSAVLHVPTNSKQGLMTQAPHLQILVENFADDSVDIEKA